MNPGKVVRPYRIDENLRLGIHYNPPEVKTHFQWPEDQHSWSQTNLRCVGIGNCRAHEGGTMCPSYRVTLEEKHSTRGRARLLWEMLHGTHIKDGWRSEEVHEALDLCLACKGCKTDCPVNVDMATYKAEFLSHYYAGRLRPRQAYAMGLIYWWARLAAHAPRLVNFLGKAPLVGRAVRWLGGIARPSAACRVLPIRRSRPGLPPGRPAISTSRRSCSGPTRLTITFSPRSSRRRWA